MTYMKEKLPKGNEILFVSLIALWFTPHQFKLLGLVILCFTLVIAAVVDWKKSTKRVRRITKRVASCGCVKARETISHMNVPQLLQINCTVCGAEPT